MNIKSLKVNGGYTLNKGYYFQVCLRDIKVVLCQCYKKIVLWKLYSHYSIFIFNLTTFEWVFAETRFHKKKNRRFETPCLQYIYSEHFKFTPVERHLFGHTIILCIFNHYTRAHGWPYILTRMYYIWQPVSSGWLLTGV